MNKFGFLILLLTLSLTTFAQRGFPKYYEFLELYHKADSCFEVKDFTHAALLFEQSAKVQIEDAFQDNFDYVYYYAATSWALSGNKNRSLANLSILSERLNYAELNQVSTDSNFLFLHKEKEWTRFIDKVKQNKEKKDVLDKLYKERTTFIGATEEIIFYPHSASTRKYIDSDSLPFISVNYGNFRIYFRGNSYAASHLNEVRSKLNTAFHRILAILDTTAYNRGINLIMVDTPEEMQELNGFYIHGGLSMYEQGIVAFVFSGESRLDAKHELFHFFSLDLWGISESTGRLLLEGSAVYADSECYYDNPVYSIASYMVSKNKTFSLQALIDSFDFKAKENEIAAYFQSAALFKYLYEKYGVAKMKILWKVGFKGFENIYGITLSQFEKEWVEFMKTIPVPENLDWDNLKKNGCG